MPPRFINPGSAATNAIEQFLVERDKTARQAMLDDLLREREANDKAQAAAELGFRTEQEARVAKAQEQAQRDLEQEREFRRASTIHTNAMPGVLDPATATLLKSQGFGDIVKEGQPTQGADLGVDEAGVNQYAVTPGLLETSGGTAYQGARAAEQARAEQAAAAQQAAAERARESNQTREDIAASTAAARGDSAALRDEMTRLRIDGERTKQEAAAKETADKATAGTAARSRLRALAQGLLDDPNLTRITGWMDARTPTIRPDTVDVEARFKQLQAALALEERGKLKGSGAISNFEQQTLANAVSALNPAAGGENTRTQLRAILAALDGDVPRETAAPAKKVTITSIRQLP